MRHQRGTSWLKTAHACAVMLAVILTTMPSAHANSGILYAASDNWPPFFMEENAEISGIGYEILTEVARRTGDKIQISRLPNKRALKLFDEGQIDIIVIDAALWNDPKNIPGMVFSDDLMSVNEYSYFRNDNFIDLKTPTDLAGRTAGILNGYTYPAFDEAFNTGLVKKVEAYREQSLLQMLMHNRVDAIFMDSVAFDYNTSRFGYDQALFKRGIQLSDAPLGIKVRVGKAEILPRLNKAIAQMKADGTIDKIVKKYTQ
jgi:polar amino acid transport system substrate-binding protein